MERSYTKSASGVCPKVHTEPRRGESLSVPLRCKRNYGVDQESTPASRPKSLSREQTARHHRQDRLLAIECLNLAFLIDAEDKGSVRWG
jgi:hypothetical protein